MLRFPQLDGLDENRRGRVRVGPETWQAVFQGIVPSEGECVRILKREGLTLTCGPAETGDKVTTALFSGELRTLPAPVAALGRVTAGILCVTLGTPAVVALVALPGSAGWNVFSGVGPFAILMAFAFVGDQRSPSRGGLSVPRLRGVIAGTLGLAMFAGLAISAHATIGALVGLLIMSAFDPVLGIGLLALGFIGLGGDG